MSNPRVEPSKMSSSTRRQHWLQALTRAELMKLYRVRGLWIATAVGFVLVLYSQYRTYQIWGDIAAGAVRFTESAQALPEPERSRTIFMVEQQLRQISYVKAGYGWEGALAMAGSTLATGGGAFLGVLFGVLAFGIEYEQQTLRTILPAIGSRARLLLSKVLAAIIYVALVAAALGAALTALYAFLGARTPIVGPSAATWADTNGPPVWIAPLSVLLTFTLACVVAMAATIAARSAVLGGLTALGVLVVDSFVAQSESVAQFTITSLVRSFAVPYTRAVGGEFRSLMWFPSASESSFIVGALWLVILTLLVLAGGGLLLRRQDVA